MTNLLRTDEIPTGAHEQTRGAPRASRVAVIGATAFMVLFAIYVLTPLWWLIVASSKTQTDMASTFGLWFSSKFELFHNLKALFTQSDGAFGRWMLNSFLYAGVGGVLSTLIAVMMGYALAKYQFPGRDTLFNVVLAGILMPATALALPLFLLFGAVDLTNTFWSVFLPSLVSPFGVYLSRIFANAAVPDEILEAARLDGSNEFRTFFTVSLRMMAPGTVTVFLFQFAQIWNNFFLPLVMLQNDKLYPLNLGLYTWNSQNYLAPQLRLLVVVGSLVSIIPVIIVFLALQRFWRTGLAAGAVK